MIEYYVLEDPLHKYGYIIVDNDSFVVYNNEWIIVFTYKQYILEDPINEIIRKEGLEKLQVAYYLFNESEQIGNLYDIKKYNEGFVQYENIVERVFPFNLKEPLVLYYPNCIMHNERNKMQTVLIITNGIYACFYTKIINTNEIILTTINSLFMDECDWDLIEYFKSIYF